MVLRGLLADSEAAALRSEVEGSLQDAYGDRYGADQRLGGVAGHYLPVMSDRTPLSASLVADDARLWQASHTLLGMATVPTYAEAVCFLGNANWHTDLGPDVEGVKFLAYLEPRAAHDGALRVVPGSHHRDVRAAVHRYLGNDPRHQGYPAEPDRWAVPAVALETAPGDVIAFDMHMLHASVGGRRRLAWSVEYLPFPGPGDRERCRTVRRLVLGGADHAGHGFDHDRWPVWRDWAANPSGDDARDTAITRLRILGVLDVAGADVGLPDWSEVG